MLRNIQPLTRMVLSGFAMVLLASGCENPAADNRGGGREYWVGYPGQV